MPKRKPKQTLTAKGKVVGRPRQEPDPAVCEEILAHVAAGKSLQSWCDEKPGRPAARTVREWRENNPTFAAAFARAREDGCDVIAETALAIADDKQDDTTYDDNGNRKMDAEWVARSRLRVDTRLKLLACWSSRYSPKVAHTGPDGGAVQVQMTDLQRRAKIASILATGQQRLEAHGQAADQEAPQDGDE